METLGKEIAQLEGALASKADVVKCAETRLDKRADRPGYELCGDEVESGLRSEVLRLRQTEEDLTRAIERTKYVTPKIHRDSEETRSSVRTSISSLKIRPFFFSCLFQNELQQSGIVAHTHRQKSGGQAALLEHRRYVLGYENNAEDGRQNASVQRDRP